MKIGKLPFLTPRLIEGGNYHERTAYERDHETY